MNVKTSITDPIEVAEVIPQYYPGYHPGKIGISLCPGKKGPSSFGGVWDRDLATDLSVIKRDFGATAIVTLMTDSELSTSNVTGLGQAVRDQGMQWFHLPIEDMTSPSQSLDEQWAEALSYVLDAITKGHNILVHCRGGLGRSGTLAAALLIELGMSNEEAVGHVRRARPGAIENREQEGYVSRYIAWPPHIFCSACIGLIGKPFHQVIYPMMEYTGLAPTLSDSIWLGTLTQRLESSGLNKPDAVRILDSYIQDFEHYIGDVGFQLDVIRKTLGIKSKLFPQNISRWDGSVLHSQPLYKWWSEELEGKMKVSFQKWCRLNPSQKDRVLGACRKISRYLKDYSGRTEARDLENNRWFSSRYLQPLQHLSAHYEEEFLSPR